MKQQTEELVRELEDLLTKHSKAGAFQVVYTKTQENDSEPLNIQITIVEL